MHRVLSSKIEIAKNYREWRQEIVFVVHITAVRLNFGLWNKDNVTRWHWYEIKLELHVHVFHDVLMHVRLVIIKAVINMHRSKA